MVLAIATILALIGFLIEAAIIYHLDKREALNETPKK